MWLCVARRGRGAAMVAAVECGWWVVVGRGGSAGDGSKEGNGEYHACVVCGLLAHLHLRSARESVASY